MFNNFRVYLRALELNDYKTSIKWRRDNEIWDMLVGPKYFVSEAYEKKWVEDAIFNPGNKLTLAICLKDNDKHVGYIYLHDIDWKNKSAGFAILIGDKGNWGKGIGKEAIILMLYHGYFVLGLERIETRQLIDNQASIKATEGCGFKREGILRNAVFKNGEYCDLNLMSILREDFDSILLKHKKNL